MYIAPNLLGDSARGMFAVPAPLRSRRLERNLRRVRKVGDDLRTSAGRAHRRAEMDTGCRSAVPDVAGVSPTPVVNNARREHFAWSNGQ